MLGTSDVHIEELAGRKVVADKIGEILDARHRRQCTTRRYNQYSQAILFTLSIPTDCAISELRRPTIALRACGCSLFIYHIREKFIYYLP